MLNVDTSDRKEQRKFGLTIGAAFAVLGLLRWAIGGFAHFPQYFLILAAVLCALGLIAPKALQPLFVVWIKLAIALNWVMTRVMLSLAFYLMITPVRLIIRLFGDDPLKRAWQPDAATYWEEPEDQPKELERYLNQF